MKRLILILFLSLLTSQLIGKEVPLKIRMAKETAAFFKANGVNKNYRQFIPFAESSIRVAGYFPVYPAYDKQDRIFKIFSKVGQESVFRYDFINVNVPGMKYSSGRVKFFSLDYGAAGINEHNVLYTYNIASTIQQDKAISKRYGNVDFREMMNSCSIPKKLKLKRIDLESARQAKIQWKNLTKQGYNPKQIYYKMKIPYNSHTEDDLDSELIYRVIVDTERYSLNWEYDYKNQELYEWLTARVR